MLIEELILREMVVAVFFQACLLPEFLFPFCHLRIPGPESFGEVSVEDRVYNQFQVAVLMGN